jgi:hypothetical protein
MATTPLKDYIWGINEWVTWGNCTRELINMKGRKRDLSVKGKV